MESNVARATLRGLLDASAATVGPSSHVRVLHAAAVQVAAAVVAGSLTGGDTQRDGDNDFDNDSEPDSDDDGMVFLPRASPFVQGLCVVLYVALAAVTALRALSVASSSSSSSSLRLLRPDALKRQQTFQRLMIAFATTRAISFLSLGFLRDVVNRLALCVFFSLVLFQVLFWIDIANPKVSTRSQRIWNTFGLANALFYAIVLGLCVLHHGRIETTSSTSSGSGSGSGNGSSVAQQLTQARLWDLTPVLVIALGSLVASLGLLYSTCKTRRRVGRVLKQFAQQSLPKRLNDRVQAKLQRALRVTNLIMGVCSVLFLLRTILYIQRPFSHQECGAIRDANACILIGYALPELVPCALFLVLMWEVEPHLELNPSRRKSSINAAAVARATEATPLLLLDRRRPSMGGGQLAIDVPVAPAAVASSDCSASSASSSSLHGSLGRPQRPSPLSSALGGSVIAAARRRLRRVLEESFGMRSDDESSGKRVLSMSDGSCSSPHSHSHSRSSSDRRDPNAVVVVSPVAHSRSRESSGNGASAALTAASRGASETSGSVWMSFQCFGLKFPSTSDDRAVMVVVHTVDGDMDDKGESGEIGRTEVATSSCDPLFHVMVPVSIHASMVLRVSVFAITRPKAIHDLNAQWLIGTALVPLAAYLTQQEEEDDPSIVPGSASVHVLQSQLSRTHASGRLVVRCEAPLVHGERVGEQTERLQRITRAFVYQPSAAAAPPPPPSVSTKRLVEEELVESVYTWEMPYQLLQLLLSDLLTELDILKRVVMEPSSDGSQSQGLGQEAQDSASEDPDAPSVPTTTTRTSAAASVGMLSEMIIQIQGDAMERKSKKWGDELVVKMEQYIDDVEAAILRYERASHGSDGLTFKPSTMKSDAGLRFLALNLHQQLLSVGNAVPVSAQDVCRHHRGGDEGEEEGGDQYVALLGGGSGGRTGRGGGDSGERSSQQILEVEQDHRESGLFVEDSDEEEGMKEGGEEEDQEEEVDELTRSSTPEPPLEALRRRVISFDSAETIVKMMPRDQATAFPPLSREQRQLAESIVALGVDHAWQAEEEEEPEPSVVAFETAAREALHGLVRSSSSSSEMLKEQETKPCPPPPSPPPLPPSQAEPFADYEMYGTTTVGAFAAHVYGFKRGGIRQLRTELKKLSDRTAKEAARVGSELTVEALEREYVELKWHIDRRVEVSFCQAMSALATCFQQTLYVHFHTKQNDRPSSIGQSQSQSGLAYLEQLAANGFVFSVESLLSTYSKEAGMLGDMEAAVRELERVCIKLKPVASPQAARFRVSVTSGGPSGLVMELPVIVASPQKYAARSMHRILGQDATTGALYAPLETPGAWARAKEVFEKQIQVVPVIFSQGMNEMQTVANTVGKDTLQKEINAENFVILENHIDTFTLWFRGQNQDLDHENDENGLLRRLDELRHQLRDHIYRTGSGKQMDILTLSSRIARLLGGGRVTCCKSAKDRTSMSVTLEEATLLVQGVNQTQNRNQIQELKELQASERDLVTLLLRTYGVRRENARKNIGRAQYCFSALQNYLLPADYQCPPGTGGGASSLS